MTEIPDQSGIPPPSVLGSPELLSMILGHLSQPDLLRLQRVSRRWSSIIKTTPNLQAKLFLDRPRRANTYRGNSVRPPLLNSFVIKRIRWSPNLETDLVNTIQFPSVESDQSLQAMADENASWRNQLLTWPPVERIAVIHGTIAQEEPCLRDLHLVCSRDGGPVTEDDGQEEEEDDEEEEEDEEMPPLVLSVRDFPHNQGKECVGIKVIDLIYGLRLHYLDERYILDKYISTGFDRPSGGEILASFEPRTPILTVNVTFITF